MEELTDFTKDLFGIYEDVKIVEYASSTTFLSIAGQLCSMKIIRALLCVILDNEGISYVIKEHDIIRLYDYNVENMWKLIQAFNLTDGPPMREVYLRLNSIGGVSHEEKSFHFGWNSKIGLFRTILI